LTSQSHNGPDTASALSTERQAHSADKPSGRTSDRASDQGPSQAPSFDLNAALERLKGRRSLVVYMHDNPDPDSLAAALGLARLLEQEIGCASTLAFGGFVGRAENRAMVEELRIHLTPLAQIDPESFDCVAIVDSQPDTGNNSLPDSNRVDIVVDHHPPRHKRRPAWCDIRADYGATSTIVLEYLQSRSIPLDAQLATALFYALRTETRDLGREASDAERAAYLHLVPQADHNKLFRICHPKVPPEHFQALDRALRSAETLGDIVAANLDELSYPDLVAEIADLLISLEGARFALCVGRFKGRVHLSLRTDLAHRKAGTLMQQIVKSDGSAGGHGTMAGGRLHKTVENSAEMTETFHGLVGRLNAALRRKSRTPVALVPGP